MITPSQNEEEFQQIMRDSGARPIFLFKHSTRCPISARARSEFQRFADEHPEVACREVAVIEQRPLSLAIAEQTGITHQSPQVLLFVSGKVVWHASHGQITREALQQISANTPAT